MEKWQSFTSENEWFSLDYPRMWDYEIIEDIPSFFDPYFGSGGVLQFFAARIGKIIPEDILEKAPYLDQESLEDKMVHFLELQDVTDLPDLQTFNLDNLEALAAEYRVENRFYTAVMFDNKAKFLLALYNCPGEPDAKEAEIISQVIKSVKLY